MYMAFKNSFIDLFCFWPITTLPSLVPPAFIQLWDSLAPAYLILAFQQRHHKPLWQVPFIHSPTLEWDIFSSLALSKPLCNRAHSEVAQSGSGIWPYISFALQQQLHHRGQQNHSDTNSNKAEPLLQVSCQCIIILCQTTLCELQHCTGQAAHYMTCFTWPKCSPEPGSACLTLHCASWTIHTCRQLWESTCQLSQLSPQDLQEPPLRSVAMKELSVNTGASTENHSFLIATHIPHLELIFA